MGSPAESESETANSSAYATVLRLLQRTLDCRQRQGRRTQGTDEASSWRHGRIGGSAEVFTQVVIRAARILDAVLREKDLFKHRIVRKVGAASATYSQMKKVGEKIVRAVGPLSSMKEGRVFEHGPRCPSQLRRWTTNHVPIPQPTISRQAISIFFVDCPTQGEQRCGGRVRLVDE